MATTPATLLFTAGDLADPAREDEFTRWSDGRHVPQRRALPGFLSARGWQAVDGGPKFMALYELESPDAMKTEAYQALRVKQYDAAIAGFERSIALAPDRPSIRKDLAYTLLKVGETAAARDQFAAAMKLDPGDVNVALEYAFLCYETKQEIAARRVFDRLRKENATAEQAFENIDRPLREGIARWKAALAADRENFSGHQELARLAEQRDELTLAAEHYEKAWRLRPQRRELLLDLGRVWRELGRTEEAGAALLAASRSGEPRLAEQAREMLPDRYPYVSEFERAIALDPCDPRPLCNLANLLVEQGSLNVKNAVKIGRAHV